MVETTPGTTDTASSDTQTKTKQETAEDSNQESSNQTSSAMQLSAPSDDTEQLTPDLSSSSSSSSPSSPMPISLPISSPAHRFELYGWKPDPTLTEDELYLDIVHLITRSVQDDGRQGHMGALIVRQNAGVNNSSKTTTTAAATTSISPSASASTGDVCRECTPAQTNDDKDDDDDEDDDESPGDAFDERRLYQNILGAGTNTPLFDNNDCTSDIHAEINALGEACRSEQSTQDCTAYITISPCKRCFAALVTFGIKRIVTRQPSPPIIRETCRKRGIEVKHLTQDEKRRQMQRINQLVNPDRTDQELMEIVESMKQKREDRKKQKQKRGKGGGAVPVPTTMMLLVSLLTILATITTNPDGMAHAQQQHLHQHHQSIYAKYQNQSQESSYRNKPFDISDSSIPVRVSLSGLGVVQGVRSHNLGVDFFGGIPFAAPPVGNRRWAPPQEPPKWAPQILDASEYGTDCYQIVDPILNPLANPDTMSEDCLYLNIFTPAGAAATAASESSSSSSSSSSQLLPVMVWLHGGAFQQGSAARPEYNARRLAQEERVVVVTVNYRLGALGFMVNSGLGLYGNYGLMDQRAALHFVKRRIVGFGGDPDNITLFGESAGAVMIGLHLQMQNDGLFHKAILQSNPMGYQFRSVVVADFLGEALSRTVDCRDLECMRTEAVEEIMRAQSSLMGIPRSVGDFFAWGPTLTTSATASSSGPPSFSTFSQTRQWEMDRSFFSNLNLVPDDIPIIIGTNKHEGEIFVHGAFPLTMSKPVYWMFVGALFKDSAPRVLKHYRPYVAQLEADAAVLAEKQVEEEENKQYWMENKEELENEYQELLKTTTKTRGGGSGDENKTLDETENGSWWQRVLLPKDPAEIESRRRQRYANLKKKAKEKALKKAAKVSIDYRPVMSRIINDYLFRCPSWHYAHLLSLQRVKKSSKYRRKKGVHQDNRNNVYVYRFSQPTHVPGYKECWGKSCHTAELPFVFESMDIIRSDYSTLSGVAQEEAPTPPEYPYTDLMSAYKGVIEEDDADYEEELGNDEEPEDESNAWSSASSSAFPLSNQLSNYTSYFQRILRHFFDDYFLEDSDEETAHDMARRWVAFARTGNPNHDESNVEWIPWRFIPHSADLDQVPSSKDMSSDENLPWGANGRELFNIWRDVEERALQDLEENDALNDEGEELESKAQKAFRRRALEVLNMEVVEDDSMRTELKRNKPSHGNTNGDNPLGALRMYLTRRNNTMGGFSFSEGSGSGNEHYIMIEQIQRMAQDMGVLGRGLSGEYDKLLGGGIGIGSGGIGNSGSGSSHGYWEDDFFPQFIELQWPPEGRLLERDCTCDFWERIRYRY
eukprot:jgi/Psemu1/68339/estExt_Genemark1.C_4810037